MNSQLNDKVGKTANSIIFGILNLDGIDNTDVETRRLIASIRKQLDSLVDEAITETKNVIISKISNMDLV